MKSGWALNTSAYSSRMAGLVWCLSIALTLSAVLLPSGVVALSSRIHWEYAARSLLARGQKPSRQMSNQLRDTTLAYCGNRLAFRHKEERNAAQGRDHSADWFKHTSGSQKEGLWHYTMEFCEGA